VPAVTDCEALRRQSEARLKFAMQATFKAVLEQKDAAAIRADLIKRANDDKTASAK